VVEVYSPLRVPWIEGHKSLGRVTEDVCAPLERRATPLWWAAFLASFSVLAVPSATWANFLLISYYLLGLGLGSLVFVAFLYVSGAGWGVALRRMPEAMAALILVACVGVAVVLLFYPSLYPWSERASEGAESGATFRDLWLSRPLFLVRALVYFTLWTAFARAIVRASRRQDEDGRIGHTDTNIHLSAAFLVVFGATCWLSSVDWIMSLEPEWPSTIFGVYHFSGLFLGALAAMTAVAIYLERQGALRGILSAEHLHDLGKLLFSFSSFWMYIWFSQYMLIWYVNNSEETSYFVRRLEGGWRFLFFLNVLLNWVVPFLVLMPRATKGSPKILLTVALVVLVGRWLDLYIMILPPLVERPLQAFGLVEAGLTVGGVGLFLLSVPRSLGKASLIPSNDPFLIESLPHPEKPVCPRTVGSELSPLVPSPGARD
jgi:hypothetical protein